MQTSDQMRKMIEGWEGCVLHAYHGGADRPGLLTIGYGHCGPDVTPGRVLTQAEADTILSHDLYKFELGVTHEVGSAPTTQGQFDALVSLAFNIGLGAEQASTVLRKHLARDYQAAADAFLLWDKANGDENDSLERRREGEAQVYLDASPE